ncbi:hypothetical protein BDV12DRAFT_160814 [Aspergillus spectabilis]
MTGLPSSPSLPSFYENSPLGPVPGSTRDAKGSLATTAALHNETKNFRPVLRFLGAATRLSLYFLSSLSNVNTSIIGSSFIVHGG